MIGSANVIRAFSESHVAELTGLSKGQLRYWDTTGFFRPRFAFENRRSPYSRVYSFRDVVGLRVLSVLRREHRVSLQHLRRVAEKLDHLNEGLWSETTLYVLNREVYFKEPGAGRVRGVVSGQYAAIPLIRIIDDVSTKSNRLRERAAKAVGKVERHRFVAHNAWVLAGTRVTTGAIARFHDAGYSVEGILREYPTLTPSDVSAALQHEERLARHG